MLHLEQKTFSRGDTEIHGKLTVKPLARVMERTMLYRLWQAPFAERKLAPLLRYNDLTAVRRILDVGCGPGTNAAHFLHADYVGLDNNPDYIASARRRFKGQFVVADICREVSLAGSDFDFILVNSFFHHVATPDVRAILDHLATLLTDDGHIHILDLVMPERPSLPRLLARCDRGDF